MWSTSPVFLYSEAWKRHTDVDDLDEYNIERSDWSGKRVTGDFPLSRAFRRAVMQEDTMHALSGFDRKRNNDSMP